MGGLNKWSSEWVVLYFGLNFAVYNLDCKSIGKGLHVFG